MDYKHFIQILRDENPVPNSVGMLTEFVNEFPYFQTAHSLLAREMYSQQHVRYERQLKIAAAYSPDRKALYSLIHPKKVNLFSTEPVVEHPHLVEEQASVISEPENLFEIPELDEIIPPDENPPSSQVMPAESNSPEIIPVSSFSEEIFDDEIETVTEDELPPADPHEIIRRRLNEILGLHKTNAEPEEKKEAEPVAKFVAPETKSTPVEVLPETKINEEITSAEIESPAESHNIKVEFNPAVQKDQKQVDQKDIIDQLADESVHAIDVIDRGELEYALEASLIQSLEKLPLIEKPEDREEIEVSGEMNSFIGWLKSTSKGDYGKIEEVHAYDESPEPVKIEVKKHDTLDLIDKFIKEEPKIVVSKTEFYSPSIQAKKSITQHEDIVSETLAKIYHQQGNVIKARSSYEKLSLLYPEKKAYFAALISAIDQEINQQNKQDL